MIVRCHGPHKKSLPVSIEDSIEPKLLQTETNHLESTLEQESPFRIIQYTEAQVPRSSRKPIASQSSKSLAVNIVVKRLIAGINAKTELWN
jgi:hypothetical protein